MITQKLDQNRAHVLLEAGEGIPSEVVAKVGSFIAWYDRALPPDYEISVRLIAADEPAECLWAVDREFRGADGLPYTLDDPDAVSLEIVVHALPGRMPLHVVGTVAHHLEHQHQWDRGTRYNCGRAEVRAQQLVTRWMQEGR